MIKHYIIYYLPKMLKIIKTKTLNSGKPYIYKNKQINFKTFVNTVLTSNT